MAFRKITLFTLFVLSLTVFASAMEFSADMIMTSAQGNMTGKMFYKPDRFRSDIKSPQQMISITRLDKKVAWNIMPAEKMYMEMPLDLRTKPMVEDKVNGEIDRKLVGSETVDGHPAQKYLITFKSGNAKEQVYQWWATDIKFPVKTAAVDGSFTQEFKNIKIESQPNSLFELPSGYQKIQIPGGMR